MVRRRPFVAATTRSGTGTSGATAAAPRSRPNNWRGRLRRGRPGLDLGRRTPSSGTCTSSSPSSPTSTGTTPRSSRPCTGSCASGSTAAWTASASTSSTASDVTRPSRTTCRPWSEIPHCASNEHPSHPRAHPGHAPARRRLRRRPGAHRRDRPPRARSGSRRTTATATSCTSPSTSAPPTRAWDAAAWRRRIDRIDGAARSARRLADLGAVRTTTSPAIAPATAAARPAPGRRPWSSSPSGAPRSSTPARSWAWRTPWSRPIASSTPADGTAAGPRSRGPRPPRTAGDRIRGCPSRPTPGERSVEAQRADPGSILHLYRRLLQARRDSPALSRRRPGGARRARGRGSRGGAPARTATRGRCW